MWQENCRIRLPGVRLLLSLFMIHTTSQVQVRDRWSLQSERMLHSSFGLWTKWGSWTTCSSSCGDGVVLRSRKCLRISVKDTCAGELRQYKSCQSKKCPADSVPFRNVQCAVYNNRPIPGSSEQTYNWVPFYGASNACDLNCLAVGYNFYYTFGRVLDGTSCGADSAGTCISGNCLTAGCDGVLGSGETVDCGSCSGKIDSCIFIWNVFRDSYPSKGFFQYKNVTRIPAGALHIKVKDQSRNILALMSLSKGYQINGNWAMSRPGVYTVAGTEVRYGHNGSHEFLEAPGPTNEDLYILVLFQVQNPGIEYEYWLPKDKYFSIQRDLQRQVPPHPRDAALHAWVRTPASGSDGKTVRTEKKLDDPSNVKTEGCGKCVPFKRKSQRKKHYCQSDFVIRVKILGRRKMGLETRYDINVKHVFKNKFPLVHREYIWVSNQCDCPKLEDNQEYIMMPSRHVNHERTLNRILLSPNSYIRPWSQQEDQQMQRLNRLCRLSS
ncbi:ADAMTS-like protein 5 isoform X1 [Rana temporaria]|uniref:ADAMTS-like protein 5 isoform X1 n=2 Tax=Rana temporaria TaxID=8407 RepID=UPI001AAC57E4|nr:ADAMTS-like protein 5 isoform X1 [Rana temporaria]